MCLFLPFSRIMSQNIDHKKIVIAHRGASGYLPEHTLEAKAMAHAMGADYLEQDLVLSKDDVPVVIHDIHLDEVTDVASIYPERAREDGRYYVIDFTWDELSRLSVTERFDPKTGQTVYPDRFPGDRSSFRLHTLQDEIEMIQGLNQSTGKQTGIYPEIKNPGFHQENGKDISGIVVKVLNDYGYRDREDRCILQCFDSDELRRIREVLGSKLFLTQLMEHHSELDRLEAYASYADAVGPSLSLFVEGINANGDLQYNDLAERCHGLGLQVHAYTFRRDELGFFSGFEQLLETYFIRLDIDGGFTDFPDLVIDYLRSVRRW